MAWEPCIFPSQVLAVSELIDKAFKAEREVVVAIASCKVKKPVFHVINRSTEASITRLVFLFASPPQLFFIVNFVDV